MVTAVVNEILATGRAAYDKDRYLRLMRSVRNFLPLFEFPKQVLEIPTDSQNGNCHSPVHTLNQVSDRPVDSALIWPYLAIGRQLRDEPKYLSEILLGQLYRRGHDLTRHYKLFEMLYQGFIEHESIRYQSSDDHLVTGAKAAIKGLGHLILFTRLAMECQDQDCFATGCLLIDTSWGKHRPLIEAIPKKGTSPKDGIVQAVFATQVTNVSSTAIQRHQPRRHGHYSGGR